MEQRAELFLWISKIKAGLGVKRERVHWPLNDYGKYITILGGVSNSFI